MSEANSSRSDFTSRVGDELIDSRVKLAVARAGDPRFHAILEEMGALHDKKQRDYGSDGDPFANIRSSREYGVPSWIGCMIRANDKVKRIQSFAQKGELANESLEDSLIDLANYAVIALVLYREASAPAA